MSDTARSIPAEDSDATEALRARLRGQLGNVPLSYGHLEEVSTLVSVADALVVGLRTAVGSDDLESGIPQAARKVEAGLDALDSYFTNAGLSGIDGGRQWLEAAMQLAKLGEPVPAGEVVYSLEKAEGRETLPWRFLA